MLRANCMVDAANAALQQAPKALNRVGVGVAGNVDLSSVVDPLVLVALTGKRLVGGEFVAVNRGARDDVLFS